MSDIFDHAFDAFQDGLDDMDFVSLMSDRHVDEMRYGTRNIRGYRVRSRSPYKFYPDEHWIPMLCLLPWDAVEIRTEKAILFRVGNRQAWVPKSQARVTRYDAERLGVYLPRCVYHDTGLDILERTYQDGLRRKER